MCFLGLVMLMFSQLNRKVKILESDLEQTEDALDEKRQYDCILYVRINLCKLVCLLEN